VEVVVQAVIELPQVHLVVEHLLRLRCRCV